MSVQALVEESNQRLCMGVMERAASNEDGVTHPTARLRTDQPHVRKVRPPDTTRSSPRLRVDQVFVTRNSATRTRTRRIIAIVDQIVVYCDGGPTQRRCQRREFLRWVRRYSAVAARARRPRTLVLRPPPTRKRAPRR